MADKNHRELSGSCCGCTAGCYMPRIRTRNDRTSKLRLRSCIAVARGTFFVALLASPAYCSLDPKLAIDRYVQQSWRADSGLPQQSITALAQSRDGFLWVGTEKGLARFDGATFTTYEKANTPEFRSSCVRSLLVAHDGTLWIGTNNGGLTLYKDRNFRAFEYQQKLPDTSITSLFED